METVETKVETTSCCCCGPACKCGPECDCPCEPGCCECCAESETACCK